MLNALTIDVEDYYMVSAYSDLVSYEDWANYESRVGASTRKVLDLLDAHGVKATFFVLGWVAEHHPEIVREIHGRGHELASHGYSHRLAYTQSREEFKEEAGRSKKLIEDITGERVLGYRAASYSITDKSLWAIDALIDEGYIYDSSVFPIHHDRYGIPDFSRVPKLLSPNGAGSILEIPLTTIRLFGKNIPVAGGGYLRLFPLKIFNWGIRRMNSRDGTPAVIYFHPWELDPEQPRLNGSSISNFRHYVNLEKTASKIERLIETFSFGPVREAFSSIIPGRNGT